MAINRDGDEGDNEQEDGKTLRRKLEAALVENRKLKAEQVLATGTYGLVKPDDLAKVEPDKVEEVAKKLQEEREGIQKSLIRETFAKRGLEGEELDAAVAEFLSEPASDEDKVDTIAQVTRQGGSRPPVGVNKNLHGIQAIEAGLLAKEKRRARV